MEDAAAAPTTGAPHPLTLQRPSSATAAKDPPQQQQHWRNFDNSVNAVSFGFVATAILISMFLVMAIFERFLRSASPEFSAAAGGDAGIGRRVLRRRDLEAQMGLHGKLSFPSPKMTVYTNGGSVLMPGDQVPTFIAHRAPVPCPPERMPWPSHQPLPSASSFCLGAKLSPDAVRSLLS